MKSLQIITISLLLTLVACGGNKVITTTDDSADYQSARQLPPLTKNSSTDSAIDAGQNLDYNSSGITGSGSAGDQFMTASIIDGTGSTMRVRIDAEINAAWPYFLNKLKTSGVTIHSRNNAAHRVEVGCGTMDDGADNAGRSGWSIFNRGNLVYEYCVMELSANRNSTLVSVFDRQGQEMPGPEAIKLLNKLVSEQ